MLTYDFARILLLLLLVLVVVDPARVPRPPHVCPRDHVSVGCEPGVAEVVAGSGVVGLAVGEVLKDAGEWRALGKVLQDRVH